MHHYKSRLDGIGIAAALICMAHCVLVPLLFSLLTLYSPHAIENIWVETGLLATSVFIGGWAIWKGYQHFHRKPAVVVFFALGILLLAIGNMFEAVAFEMVFKLLGTIILTGTHIYNWKKCKNGTVLSPSKELSES